jgi:acetyl/propionyl-CoA carboxylase alpha subunit
VELHAAAVRLAEKVGYTNAGTVEFMVCPDAAKGNAARGKPDGQKFYFLEMNTRLQVEHTVTEEVFGIDLVEAQLRIAAGQNLADFGFDRLAPRGHSIEARLYAEDPTQGFLPSPGPVASFLPFYGPGVRWEVGLDTQDEITGRFDPMIAKLVATGFDRQAAISRLQHALTNTFFAGPPNNFAFIKEILGSPAFERADLGTGFIERESARSGIGKDSGMDPESADAVGASGAMAADLAQQAILGAFARRMQANTGAAGFVAERSLGEAVVRWGRGTDAGGAGFWYASLGDAQSQQTWRQNQGRIGVKRTQRSGSEAAAGAGDAGIVTNVPGKVVAVRCADGAKVEAGQTVLVLESMKMEFELKAAFAGIIDGLKVKVGDQVAAGARLAMILTDSKT